MASFSEVFTQTQGIKLQLKSLDVQSFEPEMRWTPCGDTVNIVSFIYSHSQKGCPDEMTTILQ